MQIRKKLSSEEPFLRLDTSTLDRRLFFPE